MEHLKRRIEFLENEVRELEDKEDVLLNRNEILIQRNLKLFNESKAVLNMIEEETLGCNSYIARSPELNAVLETLKRTLK